MMKKIIFSIIMILTTISTIVFAFDPNIKVDPNKEGTVPKELEDMSVEIIGVLKWIGYAIAIGMIIYIGIKYVMAAANEKASLKQAAINYVIGAIIVAGCTTILSFVVEAFNEANNSVQSPGVEESNACKDGNHDWGAPSYHDGRNEYTYRCTNCSKIKVESACTKGNHQYAEWWDYDNHVTRLKCSFCGEIKK